MYTIQLERSYLIHLLSSVFHDTQPEIPQGYLDWEKLYNLSAYHSVSNMVFYCLNKLSEENTPTQDIILKFQNDNKKAIEKDWMQEITVEQMLKTFEERRIDCMPLKGHIIKHLYPQPDMMLLEDLEFLFRNEQTEQVKKVMMDLGFNMEYQGGSHDIYYKQPYINVEMYRRMISRNSPYYEYLSKTWNRVSLKPGSNHIYQLSNEDFFIYILIHLAKYYAKGEAGIRSIMDLWQFVNKRKSEINWDYIQVELFKIKLLGFAQNILGLCEVWFGNAKSNDLFDEMTTYIFSSGVYGTYKHEVASSLKTRVNNKSHTDKVKLIKYSLTKRKQSFQHELSSLLF